MRYHTPPGGPVPALTVESDKPPLLRFVLNGKQTLEDAELYCKTIDRALERKEHYGVIHIVKDFGTDLAVASQIAKWSISKTTELKEYCLGGACVVKSGTFRFILSSFSLVTPMPSPVKLVETEEDGVAWLEQQFEKRGLTLKP